MVGRALLILRTSPSDGSDESSGREVTTSWAEPLSHGGNTNSVDKCKPFFFLKQCYQGNLF